MNANKSMTLLATAIVIAAAGSGGMAIAGIDGGGAPLSAKRLTRGSVTGFGSIYLDGVRYNTDTSFFIIDGQIGREDDLAVGQVVTVLGTVDQDGASGSAHLVAYEDIVDGPVSAIDAATGSLTILGQTVFVDDDTVFGSSDDIDSVSDLEIDDIVEVSGYVNSSGHIVAAFMRARDKADEFDVSGAVDSVDIGQLRFSVNGLVVDYSAANIFGIESGTPGVGDEVEIFGSSFDTGGNFVATRIYGGDKGLGPVAGLDAEIEGLITGYYSLNEFDMNGIRVRLTLDTHYKNDWIFGLSINRKVEVKGKVDASGTLVADEIEFDKPAKEKIEGQVESITGDGLTVNGRSIRMVGETQYEDDSDADDRHFHASSIRVGDRVKVRGYDAGDALIATHLKRKDDD